MPVERLLYRPAEAADAIGVSRSRMYELIASEEIPSIRVGRTLRVPVEGLRQWVARRMAEGGAMSSFGGDPEEAE